MKVAFLTYGCKANRYETEMIRQSLLDAGMQEDKDADLCVINTCTVTGRIDSEILRKIKQLKNRGGRENCPHGLPGGKKRRGPS